MIPIIRDLLNYLTVLADVLIAILLLAILSIKMLKSDSRLKQHLRLFLTGFGNQAKFYLFLVAATATLGSLFFSEVAHFEPCKLCWFQRIFMYPLSILFLIAFVKKETKIRLFAVVMSAIGSVLAAYHYLLQVGNMYSIPVDQFTNCSTVGYSPSCSDFFILSFGYITIPMMSLSAFLLILISLLIQKKFNLPD